VDFEVVKADAKPIFHNRIPIFVSTNAKKTLNPLYIKFALKLCRTLWAHGYAPVNLNCSSGLETLEEAHRILAFCPLFISLHLPEERWKAKSIYHPAPWVLYEEYYAISRPRSFRPLQLMHKSIVVDPVIRTRYSRKFSDSEGAFDSLLKNDVMRGIARATSDPDWDSLLRRKQSRLWLEGAGCFDNKLEEWLEAELREALKPGNRSRERS